MNLMTGYPPGPQQIWNAALQRDLDPAGEKRAGDPDIYRHFLTERTVLRRSVTLLLSKDALFAA